MDWRDLDKRLRRINNDFRVIHYQRGVDLASVEYRGRPICSMPAYRMNKKRDYNYLSTHGVAHRSLEGLAIILRHKKLIRPDQIRLVLEGN